MARTTRRRVKLPPATLRSNLGAAYRALRSGALTVAEYRQLRRDMRAKHGRATVQAARAFTRRSRMEFRATAKVSA